MTGRTESTRSYVTQIRDVALLDGEQVGHVFCPETGLTREPPATGRVLVTTNQRILAFSVDDGGRETFIVPVEELQGVSVKSAVRTPAALVQGIMLIAGAVLIYLMVSYWLVDRIQIREIPVINMSPGALLLFVAALIGAFFVGKHYFTKEEGAVTFQGGNWTFSFPYKGDDAIIEIYQVVNSVFADRRAELEASRRAGLERPF